MDFLKNLKYKAAFLFLLAALVFALCPPARAGEVQYVYDHANILKHSERERLNAIARKYADKLSVHFVILTTNESSTSMLETYSRNFYDKNIAGVNGIFECAMMTVNMSTRDVANDFYGELRTMVSDREATKEAIVPKKATDRITRGGEGSSAY